MTIAHVVDGETELDSALFNPWVDHMNGLQTGAAPIALAGIEGALGEYGPLVSATNRVFYPETYGATLDGVTDDFLAWQATIDAAKDAGGGVVSLDGRTMYLDTAAHGPAVFDSHKYISIVGLGWRASRILCSGAFLSASNSSDECSVEGVWIDCATNTNTADGIVVDYPRRWLVNRCRLTGFGGDSIRFQSGLHSSVDFCYFIAQDPSGANGNAAIHFVKNGEGTISTTLRTNHNYVGGGNDYGLLVEDSIKGVFIGDIVESCNVGFRFSRSSGVLIQPYTELIGGTEIELFDSQIMMSGSPLPSSVTTSWSGTAVSDRFVAKFDRYTSTMPKEALVEGNESAGDVHLTIANRAYNSSTASAGILFEGYDGSEAGKIESDRIGSYHESASSRDADLVLYAALDGANVERMRLSSAAPAARADTSGATLPDLETEVNYLKSVLRSLGVISP